MRRWLLSLCLLCCLCTLPATSSAQTWQEKTSTHFRVFYQQNPAFAAEDAWRAFLLSDF